MPHPKTVLFLHGLESGPHGSKYLALCDAGHTVIAPDCRGMSLCARVETAVPIMLEKRPFVVGSSYGGLTPGMVLCAPALERAEEPNTDPSELQRVAPTIIVHGTDDDVIPIEVSRRYASRTGATLIEVDDGHRLAHSVRSILDSLDRL
jgi:pimeloyl-ACP methyl ester carboxylesterase